MNRVSFPADLPPDKAPIYTYNELFIPAPDHVIWSWLIRAETWSDWYANCKDLRFLTGTPPNLAQGTVFSWKTFNVRVTTTVDVFEPFRVLAWRGKAPVGYGYHGWVIEPTTGGCNVVTEEVQFGLLPTLGRWYLWRGLLREHQNWLEGLKSMAEKGEA